MERKSDSWEFTGEADAENKKNATGRKSGQGRESRDARRSGSRSRCECCSMLPLLMGAMAGAPPVRVRLQPYRVRA